jgi:hypothetical protein
MPSWRWLRYRRRHPVSSNTAHPQHTKHETTIPSSSHFPLATKKKFQYRRSGSHFLTHKCAVGVTGISFFPLVTAEEFRVCYGLSRHLPWGDCRGRTPSAIAPAEAGARGQRPPKASVWTNHSTHDSFRSATSPFQYVPRETFVSEKNKK